MTHGNFAKTPLGQSLSRIATQVSALSDQQQGKSLPCTVTAISGQIVTVNFEVHTPGVAFPGAVRMPIATWLYDWIPVRAGDTGLAVSADTYLGGISGLGGGTATLTRRANLSTLVFVPVAKTSWSVPNVAQRVVQGPAGALIRDLAGDVTLNLTTTSITLTAGGHTLSVSAAGVVIDGIVFGTHVHGGVQSGGSDTGPPL